MFLKVTIYKDFFKNVFHKYFSLKKKSFSEKNCCFFGKTIFLFFIAPVLRILITRIIAKNGTNYQIIPNCYSSFNYLNFEKI